MSSQTCYSNSDAAAGVPAKQGNNVPDAKISVDSGYGQYAYVGYYPISSDSPSPAYRSTSTDSMSLEMCSNYCQGSQYFSLTEADACACGPPVSSGTPTHNPPRSLACSGNDAESCGAPGSAIVYNLQGASGVTINSNSGNNISDSGNDNNSNNGNDSGNDSDDDNGNDSGQSNGTKPNNGSISSSSFGGTPSSSVGGTSNSSLGANPTSSIGGTGTAGPPPFPGGPPPAGRSGPAKIPPDSTSSAAAAGTSGTKPIPQDEPCLQGDYHIPIKTEASCPGDDFSKATDPYTEATVYNISCRTTLGGDSLPPVHADNFDACLHFCDTYRTCIGVSYVNATGPQSANCVAYRSFMGCQTAATPSSNYIAAAAANGSNYANNYQSDNALCRNATYKTVPYTDPETRYQYKISCGYIYGNTTNLPAAAMDSFRGCVAYCAAQAACVGVLYEGSGPTDGGATNCYPYSSASGSLLKYYSFSVAELIDPDECPLDCTDADDPDCV